MTDQQTDSERIDNFIRDIMKVPYSKHKARTALLALIEGAERRGRLDELERILEASGDGDWCSQMAGAVGQVGRRYQKLIAPEDGEGKI